MSDNIIQLNETLIKDNLKDPVRNSVEKTLNALLDHKANELVKAEHYEHSGDVILHVPKLKGIRFETVTIERYRRRECSVEKALIEMYLAGVSLRQVEDIMEALWGSKISPGTISNLNKRSMSTLNNGTSVH